MIRKNPNKEEISSLKKNFTEGYKGIRPFRDEEKWLTEL